MENIHERARNLQERIRSLMANSKLTRTEEAEAVQIVSALAVNHDGLSECEKNLLLFPTNVGNRQRRDEYFQGLTASILKAELFLANHQSKISQSQSPSDPIVVESQMHHGKPGANIPRQDFSIVSPISMSDIELLEDILARQATDAVDPRIFFRDLITRAGLPREWIQKRVGIWTGDARIDARALIDWAINQTVNPQDSRFTTLGSILQPLLRQVGLDDARIITAIIVRYALYRDSSLLENLMIRYGVPYVPSSNIGGNSQGPEINWQGPNDDIELQSFLRPEPELLDVGFLRRAMECSSCVCRIDVLVQGRQGTGFLIAPKLVLTNYHVLCLYENENIHENARGVRLRFGCITAQDGKEAEGQEFKLASGQPILKASPVDKLDYALLSVEDNISNAQDIKPAHFSTAMPERGTGMHILQYPAGETLKIAINSNGVTGVFPQRGLVQYYTRALSGSSGSPCFNEEWQVVALHHAQRARSFGSIREGILFHPIYEEIETFL